MATGTATVYPASYDESNYSYGSVNSSYPLSNAVGKGSDSTTYAQWYLKTGANAESYVFYKFDLSEIPSNATIDSVSCSAKGYISDSYGFYAISKTMQMYNGTGTAKGSSVTLNTSASAQNISCGTWTRAELDDCRIRIYGKRSSYSFGASQSVSVRFYGATLTVQYTYGGNTYTITSSAVGGTIEPSGSNTVNEGDSVSFIMQPDGNNEFKSLMINDSSVTPEIGTSGYYEYTLSNIRSDYTVIVTFGNKETTTPTIYIKENNIFNAYSKVYKKENNTWVLQTDIESVLGDKKYVKAN